MGKALDLYLVARGIVPPPVSDEERFQSWYADIARNWGLSSDPDDPLHFYDYRAAWKSGASPDEQGHMPSSFKLVGHPNRFVGGIDTISGDPASRRAMRENKHKYHETLRRYKKSRGD